MGIHSGMTYYVLDCRISATVDCLWNESLHACMLVKFFRAFLDRQKMSLSLLPSATRKSATFVTVAITNRQLCITHFDSAVLVC